MFTFYVGESEPFVKHVFEVIKSQAYLGKAIIGSANTSAKSHGEQITEDSAMDEDRVDVVDDNNDDNDRNYKHAKNDTRNHSREEGS
jgi:hypothetical protein